MDGDWSAPAETTSYNGFVVEAAVCDRAGEWISAQRDCPKAKEARALNGPGVASALGTATTGGKDFGGVVATASTGFGTANSGFVAEQQAVGIGPAILNLDQRIKVATDFRLCACKNLSAADVR